MDTKQLRLYAGERVVESKMTDPAKIQMLKFIKQASDSQVKVLLMDGKITKLDEKKSYSGEALWFVSVLTGCDNESSYSFLGTNFTKDNYTHSKKTSVTEDADSVKVWKWLCENWSTLGMYPTVEFWHEGRCGRCGRKLTVPESIDTGFGPECITLI